MSDLSSQEREALTERMLDEACAEAARQGLVRNRPISASDERTILAKVEAVVFAALAAREEPPYDPAQDDRPFNELTRTERIARQHASFHRQLAAVDRELQWEGTGRGRIESIRLLLAARGDRSQVEVSGDTRRFILCDDGTWHMPRENPPVVDEHSLLVVPACAAREEPREEQCRVCHGADPDCIVCTAEQREEGRRAQLAEDRRENTERPPSPSDIACPKSLCHAKPGEPCYKKTGRVIRSGFHEERIARAAINTQTFNIAWCPKCGLHGCRDSCHTCGGSVEQIPMRVVRDTEQEHKP